MSRLYDHSKQEWVNVPEGQVDDLVRSGKFTFESGIKIPSVAPDGELLYIDSDKAYEAFNDGFRWQTPEDRKVDFERQSARIKKEAADQPLTAFGTGVLSGATLGGFDVALAGAEKAGILPSGVTEQRKAVKEASPIASGIGAGVGAVGAALAAPVAGPIGAVGRGGQAALRAGEGLATTTLGKAAIGTAAEGAYWGLGEGISEAALGKPEDIATNVLLHTGLGGLTGGVFGAAIGGVKMATPALRSAVDATTDWVDSSIKTAAQKITKSVGVPSLSAAGKKEEARIFGELIDADPAFKQLLLAGMDDDARALLKTYKGAAQTLKNESKALTKELEHEIKQATKAEADFIQETIKQHKGNLTEALKDTHNQFKTKYDELETYLAQNLSTQPPAAGEMLLKEIERSATAMSKYSPAAKTLANEIKMKTLAHGRKGMTAADEVNLLRELRPLVADDALSQAGLKGTEYNLGRKLHKQINDYMKGPDSPIDVAVKKFFTDVDPLYAAKSTLERVTGTNKGLNKLFANPALRDEMAPVFAKLADFAPQLKAINDAGSDAIKWQMAFNQFKEKAFEVSGKKFSPEYLQEIKGLLKEISLDSDKLLKADRALEIQKLMEGIDQLSPFEAAVRVNKALGRDIPDAEKFLKFEKQLGMLERLRPTDGENPATLIDSLITRGGLGGYIGGPIGAAVGAGMAMGSKIAGNPYKAYKTLLQVEQMSSKGTKAVNQATKKMIDGLTGPKVRKGAAILAPRVEPKESLKQKREQFKRIQKSLTEVSTPQGQQAMLEQMGGNTENMPQIKLAMAIKAQTAIQYLTQMAPKDPLAGRVFNPIKSPWEPSDLDISSYMRRVAAVNNPLILFEKIGNGQITLDEAEAVQAVHPEVFSMLQNSVFNAIVEHGDKIPYDRRIMLGTVFKVPTDISMDPQFIAKMQSPYQPQDTGGRPTKSGKLDISPFDTVATETSKISYQDVT